MLQPNCTDVCISFIAGLLLSSGLGTSLLTRKHDSTSSSLTGSSLSSSLLKTSTTASHLGTTSLIIGQPTRVGSSLLKGQPPMAGSTHVTGNYSQACVSLYTESSLLRSSIMGPKEADDVNLVINKSKDKKKTAEKKKRKKRTRSDRYAAPPPEYDLANEITEDVEVTLPKFIPPDKDKSLLVTGVKLHDVNGLKVRTSILYKMTLFNPFPNDKF